MDDIFVEMSGDEAPVILFVNSLLYRILVNKATELHIVPKDKEVVYSLIIESEIVELLRQPKRTQAAVSSRLKTMAKFDIAEKRLPQNGIINLYKENELIYGDPDSAVDTVVNLLTFPTDQGERLMLRVIDPSSQEYQELLKAGKIKR